MPFSVYVRCPYQCGSVRREFSNDLINKIRRIKCTICEKPIIIDLTVSAKTIKPKEVK